MVPANTCKSPLLGPCSSLLQKFHLVNASQEHQTPAVPSLSCQGSTATRNDRATTIPASSSFSGAPMAQPVISNHYVASSWGFKGHEGSNSSLGVHHDLGLGQVSQPDDSQFLGVLELALQGSTQCMDLDPNRAYGHPDDVIHWSL